MRKKKIAIIPARSGSKGLPNKNILMLLGKPLIAYTIEAAIKSDLFEKVIVSTDSVEYKEISEKYGAEVILRDKELASDTATSFMVIEDILNKTGEIKYEYFVLLQPTSPFRNENHIKEAVRSFEESFSKVNFLVSMCKSDKNSDMIKPIESDNTLKFYDLDYSNYRRQNSCEYYPNGAIFIGKNREYQEQKHFFGSKSLAYLMNKRDSLDIDDKLDFEFAILLATQNKKKEILLNNIKNRITEKLDLFKVKKDITLIGHSLFDYWDITNLNSKSVNNLGIAGISTKEYLDLVLKKNILKSLGDEVILFAGTNDIVIEGWETKDTVAWINEMIKAIKEINPNIKISLIEVPKVVSRLDRSNKEIEKLNDFIEKNIPEEINYIKLGEEFEDNFGNLKLDYTYDGLHFNEAGYAKLKEVVERNI